MTAANPIKIEKPRQKPAIFLAWSLLVLIRFGTYLIIKKGKPKAKKVSKVEAKVWPITSLPYSDKETILIK